MTGPTPSPDKWWQSEIPADLEIARIAAQEGDADTASRYAQTALWELWDLHRGVGDAGVLAMLEKLDRDGLMRLIVAAVNAVDARNFDGDERPWRGWRWEARGD